MIQVFHLRFFHDQEAAEALLRLEIACQNTRAFGGGGDDGDLFVRPEAAAAADWLSAHCQLDLPVEPSSLNDIAREAESWLLAEEAELLLAA